MRHGRARGAPTRNGSSKRSKGLVLQEILKAGNVGGFDINSARKKITIVGITYWGGRTELMKSGKSDAGA